MFMFPYFLLKKARFSDCPEKPHWIFRTLQVDLLHFEYYVFKPSFKSFSRFVKFSLYNFIHLLLSSFRGILSFSVLFSLFFYSNWLASFHFFVTVFSHRLLFIHIATVVCILTILLNFLIHNSFLGVSLCIF